MPDAGMGSADSSVASDAGVATGAFCAQKTTALFCDDFDNRSDPLGSWDALVEEPTTGGVSTAVMSSDVHDSGPHSFHAKIASGPDEAQAALQKGFALHGSLTFEADVYYSSLPDDSAEYATLQLTNDPSPLNNAKIFWAANRSNGYFEHNNDLNQAMTSAALPGPALETWHHVKITLTNRADTPTTRVDTELDGTPTPDWANDNLPFRWSDKVYLQVGIANLYQTDGGDAYVDNVVVTGN